jgi:hypothetical protein
MRSASIAVSGVVHHGPRVARLCLCEEAGQVTGERRVERRNKLPLLPLAPCTGMAVKPRGEKARAKQDFGVHAVPFDKTVGLEQALANHLLPFAST